MEKREMKKKCVSYYYQLIDGIHMYRTGFLKKFVVFVTTQYNYLSLQKVFFWTGTSAVYRKAQ